MTRLRMLVALLVVACWFCGPAQATAADDDARARSRCTGASTGQLRLQRDDGRIRVELELRSARRGARWSIVVLHERRLVATVVVRAPLGGGALRVRRSVADWFGTDMVVVRATRAGETCRATATL